LGGGNPTVDDGCALGAGHGERGEEVRATGGRSHYGQDASQGNYPETQPTPSALGRWN
jgi:hypothetical protein